MSKNKKKNRNENRYFKLLLIKSLICVILFLIFLIGNKKSVKFKDMVYQRIYYSNITFAKFNFWYKKHFGNLFPINDNEEVYVFNESFTYNDEEKYLDGFVFSVEEDYLVPNLRDGIVVFIGEKDNYGKTIIIEDENGIDIWYSNLNILNIGIYDYIKKGDIVGEAKEGKVILLFQKNGEFIDYQEFV